MLAPHAVIVCLLCIAHPAAACDGEALHEVFASVERAVRELDAGKLIDSATEDHLMVSKNGEIVVGRAALASYLDRMIGRAASIESLESVVELSPDIAFHGDIAIAHGRSKDRYVFADGLDLSMTTQWSATLACQAGRWRIAAIHYSFNLFDNGLLDLARRGAWLSAAGGGLAGFLAGVLCFRRRKQCASATLIMPSK